MSTKAMSLGSMSSSSKVWLPRLGMATSLFLRLRLQDKAAHAGGVISIEFLIRNKLVRVKALNRKCPKACCVFLFKTYRLRRC